MESGCIFLCLLAEQGRGKSRAGKRKREEEGSPPIQCLGFESLDQGHLLSARSRSAKGRGGGGGGEKSKRGKEGREGGGATGGGGGGGLVKQLFLLRLCESYIDVSPIYEG